jgi:two-component system cell cycle sensor histidine kinase PleC
LPGEGILSSETTTEHTSLRKFLLRAMHAAETSLSRCYRTILKSVWPEAEDAWLAEAQIRLYRRGTRHSPLLVPVGGFLVAMATEPWISGFTRAVWWICLSGICLAVDAIGRQMDRTPVHSLKALRRRSLLNVGLMFTFLVSWCSMSIFLWAPGEPVNHMLIILVLACSLAGSVTITAVHPALMAAVFAMHVGFIIGPTAASNGSLDRVLAELSVVFALLMIGPVVALTASMSKMLTLEHERAAMVSGLQAAKEESDRERERAASAGHAKSQFLSNMNHELRTPMNAILGFSELIKSKAFGDSIEKYTEYAEIIHESGQNLLSLINDMLDLAKIEGGRLLLREADVNLSALIGEVVETSQLKAKESSISLVKKVDRGFPKVRGDERGLRQIISNLLSNALKYTPPGGCVTVFAVIEPDGRLAMGVEDTGIGIAPEDQAMVFDRFGQGRHDVTTADKGTGLGLAIVKGFAEAHDGTVTLESQLGTGTKVTAYLPATRVRPVAQQPVRKAG